MPDLMGYLGLDTKDFERGIGRAEKATGRFAKAAIIIGSILGGGVIIRAIRDYANLGKEIDDMRGKFIAGSQEAENFEHATMGASEASLNAFRKAGLTVDNLWFRTKVFFAQSILGWKEWGQDVADTISDATGLGGGGNAALRSAAREVAEASELKDYTKQIDDLEDSIIRKRRHSEGLLEDQKKILEEEVELETLRYRRALQFGDRAAQNSARETLGAKKREQLALTLEDIETSRLAAQAELLHAAHLSPQQALINEAEIRLKFEKQITQAIREGKNELVQVLKLQQDTALAEEKVARKRQTPREKQQARSEGRRFERDLRKQNARDADLSDRAGRGAQGREIDEFRGRQKLAAEQGGRLGQVAGAVKNATEQQFYQAALKFFTDADAANAFKQK